MQTKKLTDKKQNKLNRQLSNAIRNNDLSAVKAAVEAGADPNIQDKDGQTMLFKAVYERLLDKIKLLLKYKANMYIKDNEGRTPFDLSLLYCFYDTAELFLSAGYVPSENDMQKIKNHRLFEAIEENDLSAVKTAIADGADVNAEDGKGNPLLLDTNFNDTKVMRYLLENGMNPNMQDNIGWSLLHQTSCGGTIGSIKVLLEFRADMTVKEKWSGTPFGVAIHWGKYDIAELFVLNGYIPSDEDFNQIEDITEQEFLKARFTTLTVQMQEHKERLKEEAKTTSQEFAYADEIIEM